MRRASVLMVLSVLTSACARVMITRVTDSTPYKDGLRFYRPDLYLLVTMDKDSALQTSVISLPNRSQEYVLRTTAGLGATSLSATLEGGWNLTELGSTVDTKVPETITALAGAPILTAFRNVEGEQQSLKPGLYRFVFDDNTGIVCCLQRVPLKVP